jgi:two-component system NtrC family sensor kinase
MARRSRESSKRAKARPRKAETPKRGAAPTLRGRSSPAVGEQSELRRERDEVLERETATSEVLRIISNSPTDLQSALGAIAASAARLLDVAGAEISRVEGDGLRLMAKHGSFPQRPVGSIRPINRNWVTGRAVTDRTTVQVVDLQAAEGEFPEGAASARQFGHRTTLATPLLREGNPIGAILIRRMEIRPFTDKQIAVLQNFAAQAVIAIENARLLTEQREALEQQTATAEILQVINSSPGDLAPVFDAILEKAHRLCGVAQGSLQLYDGSKFRAVAIRGLSEAFANRLREGVSVNPNAQPLLQGARFVQIPDLGEIDDPLSRAAFEIAGIRTVLFIPLRKDGTLLGRISASRSEVKLFTEKEIGLLESFAAQAVIAMENARLLGELRQSLQQQTATADVLKVISRSAFDLKSVLQTLVESAARLCDADKATITRQIDGVFYRAETYGFSDEFMDYVRNIPIEPERGSANGRVLLEGKAVHVLDVEADPEYTFMDAARLGGFRTVLAVPILREGVAIGALALTRSDVRAFTDKQIELVSTFADQAVIAIENARLLGELRARQGDLARSVDELTATSDVLKIISRSTVDLETVLDTLVETAARLCRADQTQMFRRQNDHYHVVACHGTSPEFKEWLSRNPLPTTGRGTATARAAAERRTVHIADVMADPEYTWREGRRVGEYRTVLAVPLLRGDTEIGFFTLLRVHVAPFSDKEIELANTFADQAVIAIENARLFEELRDRQAELRVTFDNMGDGVVMFGADTRLVAWNRNFQTILDLPDAFLAQRPSYAEYFRYLAERGEYSTDLEAELSRRLHETDRESRNERTRPDGRVIEVRRNPVPGGGFVLIYADITERKRAEEAIGAARDAAETALRDLRAAQDRLVQTQKLASLGQLTAGIAHEIKNPLNFVNNFSTLSVELTDELNDVLKQASLADKVRAEVDELASLLKDNLGKVVQHGKRADSIVKNMLLHSREGAGERRLVEINAIIDESLNLAYHGARAEKQGFNIALERDFDLAVGVADVYPQEITRVLLNLISNGFYAATKRSGTAGDGFEPKLKATTRNLGDRIEIRIRDNGTGIPPDVQEKIFNPFFTTKPAGEGTGLGLSMSHDIVVKQHGGTIQVVTEPDSFTEFIITLPRVMP